MPAVAWKHKGSTSTTGPAAYLLQTAALHKRHYRYNNEMHHLPGYLNRMADDCSRLWSLSDNQLISHFNSTYPQPNTWRMHRLRPEMHSTLICNLLTRRSTPASYLRALPKQDQRGPSGSCFALPSMSTLSFRQWPTRSLYSKSSASAGEMAGSRPVETPTELALWRTPFAWSVRGFPAWGPKTPGWTTPESRISV